MKLLIISGTPKKEGLTRSFVTAALETAIAEGVESEVISLADLGLLTCKMCGDGWGTCLKQYRCAFGDEDGDGFNALQETFASADAFIWITPVYWGQASEAFKNFIDRLRRCQGSKHYGWGNPEGLSVLHGKPSILTAVAGGGGGGIPNTFQEMERAITFMDGDTWPRGTSGFFDYIAVNRWNQEYKREALRAAVSALIKRLEK